MPGSRNFDDFLTAYFDYAQDQFCPDVFHYWTGISTIAGALERKVWLPWRKGFKFYPNLFLLFIANPGIGKSSACSIGTELLRDTEKIKFIPTQITLAKLIDVMETGSAVEIDGRILQQSAGYFYASEASNSLEEVYGQLIPCFTDFYDCPRIWERATKKDGTLGLKNVCFNLLAASTFNYLNKLVNGDSIMGGFASRVLYIIHDEKLDRDAIWGTNEVVDQDATVRTKLLEDLMQINRLCGQFEATKEFIALWRAWFPKFNKYQQSHESEKMQAILARKNTNLFKLCMIYSASESDDLILKEGHWHKAMKHLDVLEKDIPKVIRVSQSQAGNSQTALVQAIFNKLDKRKEPMLVNELTQMLNIAGFETSKITSAVNALSTGANAALHNNLATDGSGRMMVKLIGDPNKYL